MKKCISCNEAKDPDGYYAAPGMADGRASICKVCHKARMKHRRRTNPAVQAYDRERAKTPKVKARIAAVVKRWNAANPEKHRAEWTVGNAIRDGRLVRKPCEECGDPKSHAHHDDYSKPLEVRFLCAIHHRRWHADHEVRTQCPAPS